MLSFRRALPLFATLAVVSSAAFAAEPAKTTDDWQAAPGITVHADGRISAGGLELAATHFTADWRDSHAAPAVGGRGKADGATWVLSAPWQTATTQVARLSQRVVKAGDDGVDLDLALADAGPTAAFAVELRLPGERYRGSALRIDGTLLALPGESPTPVVRAAAPAALVEIPLPAGGWLALSGTLSVLVQDNTTWRSDTYTVRVLADQAQKLSLTARLRPVAASALALGAAAVTPVRDDDGTGWTGQGENDLRALPAGPLLAQGIPFIVGDKAAVLSRDRVTGRPTSATVAANGAHGTSLYLLHAMAWAPAGEAPVGEVVLRYRDGTSETRPVKSRRDVSDWWNPPAALANGALGWAGENAQARVGLLVSRFAISDKPLAEVALTVAPGTVWMVVGVAVGEYLPLPPLPPLIPDTISPGPRWLPASASWEVEAGSALDLSALTAAPLPGRLVAAGAHLTLDGKPQRLLGANLCFSANFPDHALAERIAKALRALGYNAVRFHHHDGGLIAGDGRGDALDPDKVDRLDYLMAQCKAQGLWFTTDVYVSRRIPKGAIPELPDRGFGQEFKALVPLLPSAMEEWKRFATAWLGHRNPYTGTTWAADPALATLSLVNEDNLNSTSEGDADVRALYDQRFTAWRDSLPAAERAKPGDLRGRWLRDLHAAAYATMRDHVRSLGVTAPTTTCNFGTDWWSIAARDGFDFVDNHAYHDHPRFPEKKWSLPFAFTQRNPLDDLLATPAAMAQTRRLDKPFTVTELNYVFPNHRRAQYAAGVAAVAGLQDWDGIWRFAMAHDVKLFTTSGTVSGFDLARDPIAQLGERAMALLWRRGDLAAAPWAAGLVYDPQVAGGSRGGPGGIMQLALVARVGCLPAASARQATVPGLRCLVESPAGGAVPAGGALPVLAAGPGLAAAAVALAPGDAVAAPAEGKLRSPGGAVTVDNKAGLLTVTTARSMAAVLPAGASATLGGVVVTNSDSDEATVVVAALDGDLASGKRLLVLHLTDAQNSGVRFADRKHTLVQGWGTEQLLVRAGQVAIDLPGGAAKATTAWALDLQGRRKEQVALLAQENGSVRLDASVARAWGPCLAWEVVRE